MMDSSNWLNDNKNIMVGGKPYSDADINYLLSKNVTVIVNLTTKNEINSKTNFRYQENLPSSVQYIHFPIKDMQVQEDGPTLELVDKILELSNKNVIYIHCKGGHGRAGTIAGLLIHKLCPELSYTQVIQHIQSQHKTRKYKPTASTPQTSSQFNQLHRIIQNSKDIFFYDKHSPNYIFSNLYTNKKNEPLFIDKDDRKWYSSEAYYQAHKFLGVSPEGDEYAEIIRKTTSSHFAYLLGNMGGNVRPNWKINGVSVLSIIKQYKLCVTIVDNWEDKKEDIMKQALTYKFSQNETLKKKLLDSGSYRLIEYTPRDSFWGTFWNNNGKNRLGNVLECVRDEML